MAFRTISRRLTAIALATAAAATMTAGAVQSASASPPDSGVNSQDLGTPGTPSGSGGNFMPWDHHSICSGSGCGIPASEYYQHCRQHPYMCKKPNFKPLDMTKQCANGPQHVGYCGPPPPPDPAALAAAQAAAADLAHSSLSQLGAPVDVTPAPDPPALAAAQAAAADLAHSGLSQLGAPIDVTPAPAPAGQIDPATIAAIQDAASAIGNVHFP